MHDEPITAMMLARRVLDVLAKQQEYPRKRTDCLFKECRQSERKLKEECEKILHPKQNQLNLFDPSANIGVSTKISEVMDEY